MTAAPVVVINEPGRTPLHVVVVDPLEVGRDATGVILNDPAVSRHHLELRPESGGVLVVDLGSANGTTIDGIAVDGPTTLDRGMVVRLGDTTIELAAAAATPRMASPPDDTGLTTISRLAADVAQSTSIPPASVLADGTVTIAFTDIEASTELAYSYGDERWFDVLNKHSEVVRKAVGAYGGIEVKNRGDGFMLAFDSAHRAIMSLIDAQRGLAGLAETNPDMAVTIRAGAHTGEVIVGDDGDLFGHHVNVAARIADQAKGGEIVVSSLVREIVESRGDLQFGESRSVTLKGLTGSYLIHPVLWHGFGEDG